MQNLGIEIMRILGLILALCLSANAIASGPILVEEYQPLANFSPPMKCDSCRAFSVVDDSLLIRGIGQLWTQQPAYDLHKHDKIIVEVQVKLQNWFKEQDNKTYGSLFILAFSDNLKDDLLYFTIGSRRDARIHTGVSFGNRNAFLARSRYILPPDSWEPIKIELTATELVATASDVELIRANLSSLSKRQPKFALRGHIGLISYLGIPLEVRNLKITQIKEP
jgi:hypothetical protein